MAWLIDPLLFAGMHSRLAALTQLADSKTVSSSVLRVASTELGIIDKSGCSV